MAIQKINLGSEPLGEGGDTYRSANTKINENFSNKDHAASKLVGIGKGQIPLSEDAFKATFSNGGVNGDSIRDLGEDGLKEYIDTMLPGDRVSKLPPESGLTGQPTVFTLSTHTGGTTFRGQLAIGYNGSSRLSYRSSRSATVWSDWAEFYSDKNTKKDSNTNLLLASGDSIPQDSAASRLVGDEDGNVAIVQADGYAKSGVGATSTPRANPEDIPKKRSGFYSSWLTTSSAVEGGFAASTSYQGFMHVTMDASYSFLLQFPYHTASGASLYYKKVYNRSTGHGTSWYKIYSTGNTKLDTNGAIAPSSPTIDLYSDRIETNDDGAKMNPEFVRNGVGDYTIKNTTGLRDDGWYIKIPNDMNGNPKVAVAIDTDKDGNLSIKTYKRTFSLETFTFGPDLDEPLDIPEGRWIDLRFNDLPEDELEEPELEEEPLVDEVVEPEVVEEPTEEPSEESK